MEDVFVFHFKSDIFLFNFDISKFLSLLICCSLFISSIWIFWWDENFLKLVSCRPCNSDSSVSNRKTVSLRACNWLKICSSFKRRWRAAVLVSIFVAIFSTRKFSSELSVFWMESSVVLMERVVDVPTEIKCTALNSVIVDVSNIGLCCVNVLLSIISFGSIKGTVWTVCTVSTVVSTVSLRVSFLFSVFFVFSSSVNVSVPTSFVLFFISFEAIISMVCIDAFFFSDVLESEYIFNMDHFSCSFSCSCINSNFSRLYSDAFSSSAILISSWYISFIFFFIFFSATLVADRFSSFNFDNSASCSIRNAIIRTRSSSLTLRWMEEEEEFVVVEVVAFFAFLFCSSWNWSNSSFMTSNSVSNSNTWRWCATCISSTSLVEMEEAFWSLDLSSMDFIRFCSSRIWFLDFIFSFS